MSSIDRFDTSPFRLPLSSGGRRSLEVIQERASALRRLADETPDRRASLLDVAQRLEGLANHAALAAFGRTAHLSDTADKPSATGAANPPTAAAFAEPGSNLFAAPVRRPGAISFNT